MSYTEGRLFVLDGRPDVFVITNGEEKSGVVCRISNEVKKTPLDDNDLANARRLVACWNACQGLSTGLLESIGDKASEWCVNE